MPNIKSAKKRVITNNKKGTANKAVISRMKSSIKNVEKDAKQGSKKTIKENLNIAVKNIDKACSSGLIHKNKAAREKSRLTKMSNSVEGK